MCSDFKVYLQKAIIAHNFGRLDEAKKLYLKVLRFQPKHPEANHNMGTLARSHYQNKEAEKYFRTALNSKPNVSQFWLSYINILIELDRFHEADTLLKKAEDIGIKPKALDGLREKLREKNFKINNLSMQTISDLVQENKFEEAITASNQLLINSPNSIFLHMAKGNCNAAVGRFQIALKCFEKVLEIEPRNTAAMHNLANCYKDLGHLREAIKNYKILIKFDPSFYEAYYNLGNAFKDSRKLKDAVIAYKKLLRAKPKHYLALNNLALVLKDLGDLDSAIKMYKKAIENKPDYSEALMNQSFAYLAQRNFADGWWRYEYRLKVGQIRLTVADIPSQPQWKPGLKGRVLLWAEQGLGDMIMFSSIIWELYAVVGRINYTG
jgi:tetratricopeptide (TPR) repeat protein